VSGDFDFEPIPGIPAPLPVGERLLWQGAPRWQLLAVRAFHVRKVALYFAVLVGIRFTHFLNADIGALASARQCLALALLGLAGVGLLTLLAYASARATVYSITSRRVLIRHGIAVPMTLNIPFALIEAANVRFHAGRSGQIALELAGRNRVSYLLNWPYVRPGRFTHPEPMLRALADAEPARLILGDALARSTGNLVTAGVASPSGSGPEPTRTSAAA